MYILVAQVALVELLLYTVTVYFSINCEIKKFSLKQLDTLC